MSSLGYGHVDYTKDQSSFSFSFDSCSKNRSEYLLQLLLYSPLIGWSTLNGPYSDDRSAPIFLSYFVLHIISSSLLPWVSQVSLLCCHLCPFSLLRNDNATTTSFAHNTFIHWWLLIITQSSWEINERMRELWTSLTNLFKL